MGLIKAGMGALGGTLADQWKEFFYCDSLDKDVLMVKGQKRTSRRSSNNGEDNIITNGSGIAVADGQCMPVSYTHLDVYKRQVLELAPLSAEWSAQEIPYSVTGSYNYTSETGWNWLDLGSDGSVQLGVQDNSHIYQGDAAYLGVVPEGVVLGISADEELEFVAAFKNDLYNENLTMTMIAGQNPFAEGETQLQMTRSYG